MVRADLYSHHEIIGSITPKDEIQGDIQNARLTAGGEKREPVEAAKNYAWPDSFYRDVLKEAAENTKV
jgi:hypothetical protein